MQSKKLGILVGVIAFGYYALLCARSYTWIFAGGDSGDWLASASMWMNSQPYGSPLYILLCRLMYVLFPQHLVSALGIGLSVIPASITVAMVYLIVNKFTNYKIALISALVLLGAAIPLSQATIIEEYAISCMFLTLAFYFYIENCRKLTILMLALGSTVHVIVMGIGFVWLIVNIRDIKLWWKTLWIFLVVGILPYSMVLILMYADVPRFLSGSLSWQGINNYLSSTDTLGSMSLWEAPKRLLYFGMIIIVSLGFAVIPLVRQFKDILKEHNKMFLVALASIIFTTWLYIANRDPSTWTFMNFTFPMVAVLIGVGLYKLSKFHKQMVAIGACGLILVNGFFLNANTLTDRYPLATDYEKALKALPDYSYVISFSGGNYSLDNFYVYAQGKQVIPLFYFNVTPSKRQWEQTPRYYSYRQWLLKNYGVEGADTMQQTLFLLDHGKDVFITKVTIVPEWQGIFKTVPYNETFDRVVGVSWSE